MPALTISNVVLLLRGVYLGVHLRAQGILYNITHSYLQTSYSEYLDFHC